MKTVIFIIAAYITGVLAAVPAGPVQIEVLRRSMNGHLRSALAVILGAMAADIGYGVVAFFGIAPFLQEEKVMAAFWLAGASVLMFLGIMIIRQHRRDKPVDHNPPVPGRKRWALIGGFSLSAANPALILWWLAGAKLFIDIKLIDELTPRIAVSFIAAGGTGLASYLVLLSVFIFWAKRFISGRTVRTVNLFFGAVLVLISLYFVYTSLLSFLRSA